MVRCDLMHALRTKCQDLAAHIENVVLHQVNAPCHTPRNTLLEIVVLGSSELSINHIQWTWHYWSLYIFLSWSRIYEEHDLIIELRSVMRYKNATDH